MAMDPQQALIVLPPDANVTATVYTGTSTAAVAIGFANQYITMISTTACHIVFGSSGVTAATINHWLIPANTEFTRFIPGSSYNAFTHFRVIQDSASGTLYWYQSSR